MMTQHFNGEYVEVAGMAPPAAAAHGVKHLEYCAGSAPEEKDEEKEDVRQWPVLPQAARHGLAGEFARLATEHSEADQVAVMLTMLTGVGALMGRARYIAVGDTQHHPRLMTGIVGGTSRARKGTSWGPVKLLIRTTEKAMKAYSTLPHPLGKSLRIDRGPLSSGEGLVEAVRDRGSDDGDTGGTDDKRLLVIEGELGAALRAMQRQGSTLSMILRTGWDGDDISPLVRRNRMVATDPHICIVAHITRQELASLLGSSDVWGGLANRLLWACVRRRALIPNPAPMADGDLDRIAADLARVTIRAHAPAQIRMSNAAASHWADIYAELTQDRPGLFGAATARAEAQALRLALIYALIDGADRIEIHHLEAGLAMWRYCDASAAYLFGGSTGNGTANKIVAALRSGKLTQTDIRNLLARHGKSEEVQRVLTELQEAGRITMERRTGAGRPATVWTLVR